MGTYITKLILLKRIKNIFINICFNFSDRAPKKESLVFKYQPHSQKSADAEDDIRHTLNHICENSADLIKKEAASYIHKLVYTIRQMDAGGVERVYEKLKNSEYCNSGKKTL